MKAQRQEIGKLIPRLVEITEALQEIADEEREKYDNMPENLQRGERAQAMKEAAGALEDQTSELQNIIENLSEFTV